MRRTGSPSFSIWFILTTLLYRSPIFAIPSRLGVGMTPPNVLGAPKPTSSVMINSTLGAPFGGTMFGGHQGVESVARSWITPPNFGSGGGSCLHQS